ncbi:hypothetical protein Tco_0700682 [Tanacetum coccineum]
MTMGNKFNIEKFDGKNDFGLWQVRMKDLLEQQGLAATLEELPAATIATYNNVIRKKAFSNLAAIDTAILDEDHTLLLLTSLPSSYDNFVETLLYGQDTLKLTLNSRELQKMTEAKGDGGKGLYVRGRPGQRDMKYNHKKSQGFVKNKDQVSGSGADEYDSADDMMAMSVEELYVPELRRDLISLGTLEKEGFTVKMQSGKIKVIKGSLVVLSGTRRANCLYTLDGHVVTTKTLKEVYTTMYEEWVRQTFGCCMDTIAEWVLQGVEFEVEPQEDNTFEVESHGNFDHVAGSQEVQTQDLMYYHSARDKEQHSAHELFGYREDSNEAAFAVVAVDKIYAHELLTFNDTVACEVISKWKARLKEDMDARSDVEIWVTKGLLDKEKGNVLGMEIFRDQSGSTLRVSQSRFYNEKLIKTLLEGHSILSLEGVSWGLHESGHSIGRCGKAYVQHMEALLITKEACMILTEATKEAIWLKGLAIELGFELKIVAGIATGALSKAIPGLRFHHRLDSKSVHALYNGQTEFFKSVAFKSRLSFSPL